jgi:hypothetical protein
MKQAMERLFAEQITPPYAICKIPTPVGGTDVRTAAQVTESYENPGGNSRLQSPHQEAQKVRITTLPR